MLFTHSALIGSLGIILLALGAAGYLTRAGLRWWFLPLCWNCGAFKVRQAVSRRWTDGPAAFLLLRAYRCRGCRARYYAFPSRRMQAAHPHPERPPVHALN